MTFFLPFVQRGFVPFNYAVHRKSNTIKPMMKLRIDRLSIMIFFLFDDSFSRFSEVKTIKIFCSMSFIFNLFLNEKFLKGSLILSSIASVKKKFIDVAER